MKEKFGHRIFGLEIMETLSFEKKGKIIKSYYGNNYSKKKYEIEIKI